MPPAKDGRETRPAHPGCLCAVGLLALVINHVGVVAFRMEPIIWAVYTGCLLLIYGCGAWIAPTVQEAVDGRTQAPGWQKVLWLAIVLPVGLAMGWIVARYGYGRPPF